MPRKICLWVCGLFIAAGGVSPVALAEDQQSPVIARPIPEGPLGDAIRLGRDLVENTRDHRLFCPRRFATCVTVSPSHLLQRA